MKTRPSINFVVNPHISQEWDEFKATHSPFSIALDGRVDGPPVHDDPYYRNYDHHRGVVREETDSTVLQLVNAIRKGLYRHFSRNGTPSATLCTNDCDQDVSQSVYFGLNPEMAFAPHMYELAKVESEIDKYGGLVPGRPDIYKWLGKLAWIHEPFTVFKAEGGQDRGDAGEYYDVIEAQMSNMDAFAHGRGQELPVNGEYTVLDKWDGLCVVEEHGPYARWRIMAREGCDVYLSVRQFTTNHNLQLTLGKCAMRTDFDIQSACRWLNAVDPVVTDENKWGGSNLMIGSPRMTGSGLSLPELREHLAASQQISHTLS